MGMDKERFEAKPSPSYCRFCEFETVCPARQDQREANASKRRGGASKEQVVLDAGVEGFVDLNFGAAPWTTSKG
jgi:hypothetical protein